MPALHSVKVKLKRDWQLIPAHSVRLRDRLPRSLPIDSLKDLTWRAVLDPTAIALGAFHGEGRLPLLTAIALYESDQPNTGTRATAYSINTFEGIAHQSASCPPQNLMPFRERYGWPLKSLSECLTIKAQDTQAWGLGNWLFREMAHVLYKPGENPQESVFHYLSPDIFEPLFTSRYNLVSEISLGDTTTVVYRNAHPSHALVNNSSRPE
jgi:hypothetical protein